MLRRMLLLSVLLTHALHGHHEALEHIEHLHFRAHARRTHTRKAVR